MARKCVATSAFLDATSYFELAMTALDKTPLSPEREAQAIDLRIEARMAFSGFGQVDRWLELGREAERRADAIGDAKRRIVAMAVRAAALNLYGAPVEAIAAGEEVIRQADRLGDPGWLNFAEYGLGQAYFIAGRCREAEKMLTRPCAQLMGPDPRAPIGTTARTLLSVCCMMKSAAHTMLGELDTAQSFSGLAEKIAEETDRAFDRIVAAYSAGFLLLLGREDPVAATAVLTDALALAQKHEVRLFIPALTCLIGMAHMEQGDVDMARETLVKARERAETVGHISVRLRASIHLAQALALSERPDIQLAFSMLKTARETARQQGFESLEAEALYINAKVANLTTPSDAVTIDTSLRSAIAVATRNEASLLLAKLEALSRRSAVANGEAHVF